MQCENQSRNNCVVLYGEADSELVFSHEVYQEQYFTFYMKIQRLSEASDRICVTVSERLLDPKREIVPGTQLILHGQLRSYNSYIPNGSRLVLTVFAKSLEWAQDAEEIPENPNSIRLNAFLCKPPVYRITPFGREITDLLLAVNRSYNKSDYLPSIAWGRNARYASELLVGDHVEVTGRIQSREYQKKLEDGSSVTKVAYEVSITTIARILEGEAPRVISEESQR